MPHVHRHPRRIQQLMDMGLQDRLPLQRGCSPRPASRACGGRCAIAVCSGRGTSRAHPNGAQLPEGVDTVVLQEDVATDGQEVVFHGPLKLGANTRKAGEDVHPRMLF